MTKSLSFNLRPHHSLCIQFFRGEGYSDEFVSSMSKIIKRLEGENPLLTLTNNCDIICENCPNNKNYRCLSEEKTAAIDRRCLDEYGLKAGDKIRWNEIKELAREKIISKNKIPCVCRDCEWRNLCRQVLQE